MPLRSGGDDSDILVYFFGFWIFVFNKQFRAAWIGEFKRQNLLFKLLDILEALGAIVIGVVFPIGILVAIL